MEIDDISAEDLARIMLPENDDFGSIVIGQLAGFNSKTGVPELPTKREYSIFDNRVVVGFFDQTCMVEPRYKRALAANDVFDEAGRYLNTWPGMFQQVKALSKVIQPFNDSSIKPEYIRYAVGSSSSSEGLPFGYLCVTVDNAIGLAQAIVHEFAHHKLRAIGIDEKSSTIVDCSSGFIASPLDITHRVSPARAFHDIYTYMHVLQLNITMAKTFSDSDQSDNLYQLLFKNRLRIEYAFNTVIPDMYTKPQFKTFYESLIEWMYKGLLESKQLLAENQLYGDPFPCT
jgi:hypothetical protein